MGSCCICRYERVSLAKTAPITMAQLEAANAFDQDAHHTAMHLGKAVGMVRLLQGVPYHASLGRCYLPAHVCAARGMSVGAIRKGQPSEALKDVVLDVASVAKVGGVWRVVGTTHSIRWCSRRGTWTRREECPHEYHGMPAL